MTIFSNQHNLCHLKSIVELQYVKGSSTGFYIVGPAKVKPRNYFLFTEGSPEIENKEHLFDFVVALYLHQVTEKLFQKTMKIMGLCLFIYIIFV